MKFGVACIGIVPLRQEPTHKSELISQLLFGEIYEVVESTDLWLYVKCTYDGYHGWMDINQHQPLDDKDYDKICHADTGVALDLVNNVSSSHRSIPVVAGSTLPKYDGLNFKIGKEKFIYNGQVVMSDSQNPSAFERVAMRYQNAPYLWGGRSPFGIDCSGYSQIVFKFLGIPLPRDAYQQAERGTIVNFIEEAVPGDLAFFCNEEGRIIHVGMILKGNKIIHASGKVRIDTLDHFGIYNSSTKRYSHQLKTIKRFF